ISGNYKQRLVIHGRRTQSDGAGGAAEAHGHALDGQGGDAQFAFLHVGAAAAAGGAAGGGAAAIADIDLGHLAVVVQEDVDGAGEGIQRVILAGQAAGGDGLAVAVIVHKDGVVVGQRQLHRHVVILEGEHAAGVDHVHILQAVVVQVAVHAGDQ